MRIRQNAIVIFFSKEAKSCSRLEKVQKERFLSFRERKSFFSLDFWPFGPSVLDGARSKNVLCGEGYAWTPIWWSSENSKR